MTRTDLDNEFDAADPTNSPTYDGGVVLRCDMTHDCEQPVAMIDNDGYAYCADHGLQRRWYQPCRKLRPYELRKLQRGEQLAHY